jgi:hypothetical protein
LRKIAAILLIIVLFFNLGGYRILFPLLQTQAEHKLETLLDNNQYEESELIEIRVALNLPYQQRFTEYERHYGQIEIDGKSYTYVKSKIEGDVAIFKCIPNESREQLNSIQNNITKANSAADMDHSGQSKKVPVSFAKNILSDYDDRNQFDCLNTFVSVNGAISTDYRFYLPLVITNTPHQPPEC